MDQDIFLRITESLRQYRRAELKDFETELGQNPVKTLYVDPLPNNAILKSVMSSNTTFLLGRKGTGKSTIFANAQNHLKDRDSVITVYIDVKSLYDILEKIKVPSELAGGIDDDLIRSHLLRKNFLGSVLNELLDEVDDYLKNLSIIDRWNGKKKSLEELETELGRLKAQVKNLELDRDEIPILQKISKKYKSRSLEQNESKNSKHGGVKGSAQSLGADFEIDHTDIDKIVSDDEVYNEYSDIILRSLPFSNIIKEIQSLLEESGHNKLIIFFDDFSELQFLDQRLFVDVVLSPLNNSSNDKIKLKVAGYPGRIYYGKIDPTKVDTLHLDFSNIYEAKDVQSMEEKAIDYASRLLYTRFDAFDADLEDYFDDSIEIEDYLKLIFQSTFNVPRLMGALLHQCYFDKVSNGEKITIQSIKLAAQKYFNDVITQYFDQMTRFALEPFSNKIDRNNQQELLKFLIEELRSLRLQINNGKVGGTYFDKLNNPPVSHFIVKPKVSDLLKSLESNFLLSKYKSTRDKDGNSVEVYALNYGLTESEKIKWGYPAGREYRNYFVQRCFDLTSAIHDFLSNNQTIRCDDCGKSYPLEKKQSFELYNWSCPECNDGTCKIVNLIDDFREEVDSFKEDLMLEKVELEILNILNNENREMRASGISKLIDVTYQLVGKRTSKLQDLGLVEKSRGKTDNHVRSTITERAQSTYFNLQVD